jgi:pilus assembly protein CpaB
MRSKAALGLSIVLGVLAVAVMSVYVSRQETTLLQQSSMKDVLVATTDILQNTVLDERLVQQIQVPSKYLQPKALSDVAAARGRVVTVPIPKGSQIVGTELADVGESALAYEVPRGRRAITVAVSDVTGVGGLISPGNFIDILGTFEYGKPVGYQNGRVQYAEERTETLTMMQNVQVVAVEKDHARERTTTISATEAASMSPADQARVVANQQREAQQRHDVRNITVLVAPAQVQELVLAQHVGTLTMALRSNLDAGQVVDLGRLDPLGLLKVQIPVKPRSAPSWREIRGTGAGGF